MRLRQRVHMVIGCDPIKTRCWREHLNCGPQSPSEVCSSPRQYFLGSSVFSSSLPGQPMLRRDEKEATGVGSQGLILSKFPQSLSFLI